MAHKKYIKRGNKVFGPYLYKNYRVNGITKTKYLGKAEEEKRDYLRVNWEILLVLGLSLFILIAVFVSHPYFEGRITGSAILETNSYQINETISGNLNLALEHDELIPANSIIKASLGSQEKEIPLSELITEQEGFKELNGSLYLVDVSPLNIDLSKFNLIAEQGELKLELLYNDTMLASASQEISLAELALEEAKIPEEKPVFKIEDIIEIKGKRYQIVKKAFEYFIDSWTNELEPCINYSLHEMESVDLASVYFLSIAHDFSKIIFEGQELELDDIKRVG